jgi:hypothetical protein
MPRRPAADLEPKESDMTITTSTLTRAAGVSAVAGGLLFLGVQIGHPHLDAAFASTPEFVIRQSAKIGFAVLSLVGVTGMYLQQVKRNGVLGLIGYLLLGFSFLTLLSVEVMGAVALPALVQSAPGYVNDVLTVAMNGTPTGDVGAFAAVNTVAGLSLIAGGLLFGIALFRAHVLTRWPAALLAVGVASTLLIRVLPQVNERLFAVPIGVALVGLGVALWRSERAGSTRVVPSTSAELDPAGAK